MTPAASACGPLKEERPQLPVSAPTINSNIVSLTIDALTHVLARTMGGCDDDQQNGMKNG
jgi:hypothetical protein